MTVRNALIEMAKSERKAWEEERKQGCIKPYLIVLDNIQAYARHRDSRIGTHNKLISGTAATAIEMEDCPPDAFNLRPLLDTMAQGDHANVSVEGLLDDIDFDHLRRIGSFHWLQALVSFVPALANYQSDVSRLFSNEGQKHQINPKRHSSIHPLGTNSENEVTTRGLKRAMSDFLEQMGITEEYIQTNQQVTIFSGDGKTFEGMLKIKKYLQHEEPGDFRSFRFVEPNLAIWHAKWTDLSRICRGIRSFVFGVHGESSKLQCTE